VRIVFLRTVIAAALCAAACASASRSGKSNASVASAAPSTRAPTASSPGESLARAAAIWARIDRGAVAGADVLQELAREARSCADDARRAWLAVQPEAADAKSLPQVLAAAGPAAAQPMYLTAACTSAWTRAQGFTLLIDHRDELARIAAVVLVETESQKGILIGAGGRMIKSVGTAARKAIESELGVHVHLELSVRVRRHWRADERLLDRLGIE